MFTEAQNFAIVQTELDRVFFQNFEYDATNPSIATAQTSALFKPMNIDRAAYIEENLELLEAGLDNLRVHIRNAKRFGD